jgi:hypothetical protein
MPKTKSEIDAEKTQSDLAAGQSLVDKTRFENAWAENPASVATQSLVGQVSSEIAESKALAQRVQQDEENRKQFMAGKPPKTGGPAPEPDFDAGMEGETPLPKRPFRN